MKYWKIIFHTLLPLLVGGFIYLFFRSSNLKMFSWLKRIGLEEVFEPIRENFTTLGTNLPDWILYSLPDGLWVYAFTSAILIIWDGKPSKWLFLPVISGPIVELFQLLNLFPGTFDLIDLGLMLLAILLSFKLLRHEN